MKQMFFYRNFGKLIISKERISELEDDTLKIILKQILSWNTVRKKEEEEKLQKNQEELWINIKYCNIHVFESQKDNKKYFEIYW